MEHSRPFYFTSRQIAESVGATINKVNGWIEKSGISGRDFPSDGVRYFTKSEVRKIISSAPAYKYVSERKIRVIEMRLSGVKVMDIAAELNMSTKDLTEVWQEWKDTGCVIVESRMNKIIL